MDTSFNEQDLLTIYDSLMQSENLEGIEEKRSNQVEDSSSSLKGTDELCSECSDNEDIRITSSIIIGSSDNDDIDHNAEEKKKENDYDADDEDDDDFGDDVWRNNRFIETDCYESLGPFLDMPDLVKELIQTTRDISDIPTWLKTSVTKLFERRNVIYFLPSDNDLMAEIHLLREILCLKQNALYVLPHGSNVEQKVSSLSIFAVNLNFILEEYVANKGQYPPRKRRRKNVIYIATIKKAIKLVSSLLENGRLDELGLVVIDSLHFLGDSEKGIFLEILLTKLMYTAGDKVRIIAMSEKTGNVAEMADFLGATICTVAGPNVHEYVKHESDIYSIKRDICFSENNIIFRRKNISSLPESDPSNIGGLVLEAIYDRSVLVFCSSNIECKNMSLVISQMIPKEYLKFMASERLQLCIELGRECNSLCANLKCTIPFGIAYYHSGQTVKERALIEDAFKRGVLCCICCTPLLAAQMDLTAHRVIISCPFVENAIMKQSMYISLIRRAKYAPYFPLCTAESFLVCSAEDTAMVAILLFTECDKCDSKMLQMDCFGVHHLIMTAVAENLVTSLNEAYKLIRYTFLQYQTQRRKINMKLLTKEVVLNLLRLNVLQFTHLSDLVMLEEISRKATVNLNPDTQFKASDLTLAAVKAHVSYGYAKALYEDLRKTESNVSNTLHLFYLVTPYDYIFKINPDKRLYSHILKCLTGIELEAANIIGISHQSLFPNFLSSTPPMRIPDYVLKRFYLALMLYDYSQKGKIAEVACKYRVEKGFLQQLMYSTFSFAASVIQFCEEVKELLPLKCIFATFLEQHLLFCDKELVPLMQIPCMEVKLARHLYNAGFTTLRKIARCDVQHLVSSVVHMSENDAQKIKSAAEMVYTRHLENIYDCVANDFAAKGKRIKHTRHLGNIYDHVAEDFAARIK